MKKIDFKAIPDKSNKKLATVRMNGDLSLQHLETILPDIKKTVEKYDEMVFEIDKVEAFDLAAVQMIYSIKKSCDQEKKIVRFDINLPEDLEKIIINSGFVDMLNSFNIDKPE